MTSTQLTWPPDVDSDVNGTTNWLFTKWKPSLANFLAGRVELPWIRRCRLTGALKENSPLKVSFNESKWFFSVRLRNSLKSKNFLKVHQKNTVAKLIWDLTAQFRGNKLPDWGLFLTWRSRSKLAPPLKIFRLHLALPNSSVLNNSIKHVKLWRNSYNKGHVSIL